MKRNLLSSLFLIALCCLSASCASAPRLSTPSSSVVYVPLADLKDGFLGPTQNENPYIEPVSVFRGRTTEFVVLRIDYYSPVAANVSFSADIVGEKGESVASLKTLDGMRAFWDQWGSSRVSNEERSLTLDQTYVPDLYFESKPGAHSYYAVLTAKFPIQRPATLRAELRVDGIAPAVLDIPLPEPASSKLLGLF